MNRKRLGMWLWAAGLALYHADLALSCARPGVPGARTLAAGRPTPAAQVGPARVRLTRQSSGWHQFAWSGPELPAAAALPIGLGAPSR